MKCPQASLSFHVIARAFRPKQSGSFTASHRFIELCYFFWIASPAARNDDSQRNARIYTSLKCQQVSLKSHVIARAFRPKQSRNVSDSDAQAVNKVGSDCRNLGHLLPDETPTVWGATSPILRNNKSSQFLS